MGLTTAEVLQTLPSGIKKDPKTGRNVADGPGLATVDERLLAHVIDGNIVPVQLYTVQASDRFSFQAMRDALMWGSGGDAFRGTVTHLTAQRIADFLGLLLPTSKLVDDAFALSIRPDPKPGSSDDFMASTERMLEHSRRVDAELARVGASAWSLNGPNVGKQWVNTRRWIAEPTNRTGFPNGANYGWRDRETGKLIQDVGLAHDIHHRDYSQVFWAVGPLCWIDGKQYDLAAVAMDPKTCAFVNYDGPIQMRHPAIPRFDKTQINQIMPAVPAPAVDVLELGKQQPAAAPPNPSWRDPKLDLGARMVAWFGWQLVVEPDAKFFLARDGMTTALDDACTAAMLSEERPLQFWDPARIEADAKARGRWHKQTEAARAGWLAVYPNQVAIVVADQGNNVQVIGLNQSGWTRVLRSRPPGFVDLTEG